MFKHYYFIWDLVFHAFKTIFRNKNRVTRQQIQCGSSIYIYTLQAISGNWWSEHKTFEFESNKYLLIIQHSHGKSPVLYGLINSRSQLFMLCKRLPEGNCMIRTRAERGGNITSRPILVWRLAGKCSNSNGNYQRSFNIYLHMCI